jgi:hypothetical protein
MAAMAARPGHFEDARPVANPVGGGRSHGVYHIYTKHPEATWHSRPTAPTSALTCGALHTR